VLMRKGEAQMVNVELGTREADGIVVVVLRGELGVANVTRLIDVSAARACVEEVLRSR